MPRVSTHPTYDRLADVCERMGLCLEIATLSVGLELRVSDRSRGARIGERFDVHDPDRAATQLLAKLGQS